jgi:uncharacterized membrane protein YedE/YeeE
MDDLPVTTVVATLAFVGGTVMGMTARSMHFCTFGAIADAFVGHKHKGLRAWALAIATATLASQSMHMAGVIDLQDSIYLTPDFGWLGAILGGLCFGFGMALVGTCGYGTLVRLGGGDLRSLVDLFVLAFFAYMTLRGLSGLGRVLIIEPTNADLSALGGQGLVEATAWLLDADSEAIRGTLVALVVVALLAYSLKDRAFRHSRQDVAGGIIIGLVVASGWVITGVVGADDFDPVRLASYSFVTPVGESLVYLMTFSGATINFGVGAVGGVIFGDFLASRAKSEFRLEAFDDPKEMLRHVFGAALMGFGGVTALGCTVGQGITAMSTLSMSAPLALASIFLGAYLGLRYLIEGSLLGALKSGFARY